jgi:CPA2 family monovalent cation:H+ antiporter-2
MEIPLLRDIVIIFVLSMVVVYISHQIKLPVIVGLLVTGILAGPNALGLIDAVDEVDKLAKIGVILLLFTIGIEFSLRKLVQIKTLVLVGGALQVGATITVVYAVATQVLGWPFEQAIFMGFLISLSSTAIVLKLLQERAEMETPYGRIALGILIFQDIIVVLFLILTPFLAGEMGQGTSPSILRLAATGIILIALVLVGARYVVPVLLYRVVRTRSRELFMLTVGGICFAVAFIAAELSLALGAFLAGLIISESEYSHDALEHITPFRDIFTSFFFVSVGMLFNVGFLLQNLLVILIVVAGILLLKSIIVALTTLLLGFSMRTSVISGLGLSQVGEFSFILASVGSGYNLLPTETEQMFLAVSVITMIATPFMMAKAPAVADFILRAPMPQRLRTGIYTVKGLKQSDIKAFQDHLVIIGYGINGRNVAKAAKLASIPYVVIEANAETVRREQTQNEPVYYGDASQEAVLNRVNIAQARTVAIVIAEAAPIRRITGLVRRLNPSAHIITRTRYINEMEALYKIGADEVIPEEFETSVEIFTRVLTKYLVPRDEIARLLADIRADGYQMFRTISGAASMSVADLHLHLRDIEIAPVVVAPDSPLVEKTLAELDLRNKTGLTLLALRRDAQLLTNPNATTKLQPNDELFVIGSPQDIATAFAYLC